MISTKRYKLTQLFDGTFSVNYTRHHNKTVNLLASGWLYIQSGNGNAQANTYGTGLQHCTVGWWTMVVPVGADHQLQTIVIEELNKNIIQQDMRRPNH